MERKVEKQVTGYRTEDGAGVKLVRVLGPETITDFDPILMLDSFDSYDPKDYIAGFPMHPHRGIETITYLNKGKMTHRDSLNNEDTIADGEVQWMTAGSGIFHEEMIPAADRMLGVQLWLNLPQKDKMTIPSYHKVENKQIEEIEIEGGKIRLLAGKYGDQNGHNGEYLPLDYYDIHLLPESETIVQTMENSSVMMFTLIGNAYIAGKFVPEKTAVKLSKGDFVRLKAAETDVQVLFMSSKKLGEKVAWGGPIVMNTEEELEQAFEDIRKGKFLKRNIQY